jgi:sarcosine oxidase subunit gamma
MVEFADQAFSPLDHLNVTQGGPSDAGVSMGERRFVGKINLRTSAAKIPAQVVDLLGGDLPAVGRVSFGDHVTTAWLGPDEFLILTPPAAETALQTALEAAFAGQHAAVTDLTDNATIIRLAGPEARWVMRKGVSIDLHPQTFSAGNCAQTMFERAQITLIQLDETPSYDLIVRNSFAPYLWAWLVDASQDVGVRIV